MNNRFSVFFIISLLFHILIIFSLFDLLGKSFIPAKKQTTVNIHFNILSLQKNKLNSHKKTIKKPNITKTIKKQHKKVKNDKKIKKSFKKPPIKKLKEVKIQKKHTHPKPKRLHKKPKRKKILTGRKKTNPKIYKKPLKFSKAMEHQQINYKRDIKRKTQTIKNYTFSSTHTVDKTRINRYIKKIYQTIKDAKFYPRKAKMLDIEGDIHVKFLLTKNKKVKILYVKPRIRFLSDAAIKIIRNAIGELSAPPEKLTLSVTISFKLE